MTQSEADVKKHYAVGDIVTISGCTDADNLKNTYKYTNIEIFNTGVGNSNKQKIFNELPDSNSSTFK